MFVIRYDRRRPAAAAPLFAAALGVLTAGAIAIARAQPGEGAAGITISQVPLNPDDLSQDRVGRFRYAGGLAIAAPDDPRYHDFSDLDVTAAGRLLAVGDRGQLVRARLVLDDDNRLTGLADLTAARLTNLQGQPLDDKAESDAEGLAMFANGDMLVSFERQNRIWRYPANGQPPVAVPSPAADFPDNGGMEALGADPARGPLAYIAAGEVSGQTWRCDVDGGCTAGPTVAKADGFGVVAVRPLPGGGHAWLLRTTTPFRGRTSNIIILRLADAEGRTIEEAEIRPPMTVDNFEGLAVVPAAPAAGGGLRFYLVSDDNAPSKTQRTLLLAFDWQR